MVREPDATMQPTLHDNQLMSKHRVLGFKPQLRLEWRGQDGQNETKQPDHSASLGDFITSSTRIRFSVHTGGGNKRSMRQCLIYVRDRQKQDDEQEREPYERDHYQAPIDPRRRSRNVTSSNSAARLERGTCSRHLKCRSSGFQSSDLCPSRTPARPAHRAWYR